MPAEAVLESSPVVQDSIRSPFWHSPLLVGFFVFVIVGVLILLYTTRRDRIVAKWPVAEGTVESLKASGSDSRYFVVIAYYYRVSGNWYAGKQVHSLPERAPFSYLKGMRVEVSYNPAHPETSRLRSIPDPPPV